MENQIVDIELEQYLASPGDPELAELFREIEAVLERFDTKQKEARRLCREVSDLAFSVDLECAEFIYELGEQWSDRA